MIKKINKKVALSMSLMLSSIIGFVAFDNKGGFDPHKAILEAPIFSIEKANADAGSGDCCCSSTDGYSVPEPLSSTYVNIQFSAP